jgi:hypothetical protein
MGMRFGSAPERRVNALITMKPTIEGGIKGGFDCPVVSFFHRTPQATLWVAIAPEDGRPTLSPGDADVLVELTFFWLDQDISHVVKATEFEVWYADRAVGQGRII